MEHIADRLTRKAAPALVASLHLSVPVGLMGYAWMVKAAMIAMPWWVFAPVIIAHLVFFLGIASLIDTLQERLSQLEPD